MKAPFFTTGEYEEKTMGRRELRESIFQLLFMDILHIKQPHFPLKVTKELFFMTI